MDRENRKESVFIPFICGECRRRCRGLLRCTIAEGHLEIQPRIQRRDQGDVDALSAAIRVGSGDPRFDLNGDGSVDGEDRDYFLGRLVGTLPGDANWDKLVDGQDFNLWNDHKGQPAGWASGDFTGDGIADAADFAVIEANRFFTLLAR